MSKTKIADRIRKLLELARRGGTQAEAEVAAAQAARLMAKHNLKASQVDADVDSDAIDGADPRVIFRIDGRSSMPTWMQNLGHELAAICGCYSWKRIIRGELVEIQAVGRERDLDTFAVLYSALVDTIKKLTRTQVRDAKRAGIPIIPSSYSRGVVYGLVKRMTQAQNEVMDEIRRTSRTALSPVDWSEKAKKAACGVEQARRGGARELPQSPRLGPAERRPRFPGWEEAGRTRRAPGDLRSSGDRRREGRVKVQRWQRGRSLYRPAGEPIETHRYEVAPIASDRVAKAFVVEHHYSGMMPAARFRYGLWCGADLVGVAVFSVAQNPATYAGLPGSNAESVDLGRFILLDEVPANGETWFLRRAFDLLRRAGIVTVVSFSDPVPRRGTAGTLVMPGHVGTIYQAHNAVYLGRSKAERKWLTPDGRVIPGRALTKIRRRRRGWRYAADLVEALGADPLRSDEDAVAWVGRWLPALCRPLRHPGNHKYAWALPRRARRHLPPSRPYPKQVEAELPNLSDHSDLPAVPA